MKFLSMLGISVLLSLAAYAQTTYDISTSGGTLTAVNAVGLTLTVKSTVVSVVKNGVFINETGTVTLTTADRSGGLQLGCIFQPGGTFVVTTADEGEIFSGTISATPALRWRPIILANSGHFYRLLGTIHDAAGNTGTFVLETTTAPTVPGFFNGKETVAQIGVNFTIQ